MSSRMSIVYFFLVLLLVPQINAKNKKKQLFPEDVLRAQRVLVVIHPDASEALTDPMANRTAQNAVEKAITRWGRFSLVVDPQTADLIIAVRKGNKSGPVISHSPVDDPPVIYPPAVPDARVGRPTEDRVGPAATNQQMPDRRPDLTQPFPGGSANRGPELGNQIGSSDDTFEVYRGGGEYPLDTPSVWRYIAKGSLDAPQVDAVEQFRKAIEESEKQSQHKP